MDVIFAEASPPGRGGVSVIRISGQGAAAILEELTGKLPRARHAVLRHLRDGDEVLDQALVIWFEKGRSFTGEEVAELQLHGAPVVVQRVKTALMKLGCRLAEAGEFTRRAFLNGRMDLAEIEGLGDLLIAETEGQRQLALKNASGALGKKAEKWRQMLIRAGALIEVSVDFADEDVPDEVPSEAYDLLRELGAELDTEIRGFPAAERMRKGFEVAVIGPPNAGKSSFINYIANREVALVSDIPGTTRDVLELRLDLKGLAVTFLDTAGMRESADQIEAMGVERAVQKAASADMRLHLSTNGEVDETLWRDGDLAVRTKTDINAGEGISVFTGAGISEIMNKIYEILSQRTAGAGLIAHERQLIAIKDAGEILQNLDGLPAEILGEAVRQASSSLDRLLGRIGAEDYLDVIFSSFCIGK